MAATIMKNTIVNCLIFTAVLSNRRYRNVGIFRSISAIALLFFVIAVTVLSLVSKYQNVNETLTVVSYNKYMSYECL